MVRALAPAGGARLLSVGCGPAHETVAIARANDAWTIDAIDPSPTMIDAARETVRAAKLESRISVHAESLSRFERGEPYDVVFAVLVGHFIPDDGARAAFLRDLSNAVRAGGCVLLVEHEHAGESHAWLVDAHVAWSRSAGLPEDRLETLRERLSTGFHALCRERLLAIAGEASLTLRAEFFRGFGFVGLVFERTAVGA